MEEGTIILIEKIILIFPILIIAILFYLLYNFNEKMNRMIEMLFMEMKFREKEYKLIKEKNKLKEMNTDLMIQCSFLLFEKNNTNDILLLRMILMHKIASLFIAEIVSKHKKALRRTKKKYLDILKSETNKNKDKFYIIYCGEKEIKGVTQKMMIII